MARQLNVRYMTFKDVHIPRTDSPEALRATRAKIEAAGITIMGGGTITMENDASAIRKDSSPRRLPGFRSSSPRPTRRRSTPSSPS